MKWSRTHTFKKLSSGASYVELGAVSVPGTTSWTIF